jgi:hypothetical protein
LDWTHLAAELPSKHVIEGNMARKERKYQQLMDELKKRRLFWNLKEEAPSDTLRKTGFGRDCEYIVSRTEE